METTKYVAFLSYVHADDEADRGKITFWFDDRLRSRLRQRAAGRPLDIFVDKDAIRWGQEWRGRLGEAVADIPLFIPIVTPSYFSHKECRQELEEFLAHEKRLGRRLVLPIYWLECDLLEIEDMRTQDELAQAVADRQRVDWRELRGKGKSTAVVDQRILELAKELLATYQQLAQPVDTPSAVDSAPSTAKEVVQAPAVPARDQPPAPRPRRQRRGPASRRRHPKDADVGRSEERIVVDQDGDMRTIGEALKAVSPGGEVLVRPGVYEESVTIDKSVHLSGDGERDQIIVEAVENPALTFETTMGVVANLSFRQTGGGGSPAIRVLRGRLEIDGCDMTATSESCVVLTGGADVRIRRSTVHGGSGNGIEITGGSQALIEDSEVSDTASPGVAAVASEVVVRNSQIHGCGSGVLLQERARGTIEGSELYANNGQGIIAESESEVVVRGNSTIRDGAEEGVMITNGARGSVEGNTISGNGKAAVLIGSGSDPIIRDNRIRDGKDAGIAVSGEGALGTIEGNDISGNEAAGVAIDTGGNPTVRGNQIHDGQDAGVYVHDRGRGIVEDNVISGNAAAGVWITSEADPAVRRNEIRDQPSHGIVVLEDGKGTLEDNRIFQNGQIGVRIASGGNPTVQGNQIYACEGPGVRVEEGGAGTLEGNDIAGNASDGIAVMGTATPVIRNNRIHDGADTGIFITDGGQPTVQENDIFGNVRAGIWIQSGGAPQVTGNQVHDHPENGVVVAEGGQGNLEGNLIYSNGQSGVLVASGGHPSMERNRVTGNGYVGIRVLDGGDVALSPDNDLSGNYLQDLEVFGQAVDARTF